MLRRFFQEVDWGMTTRIAGITGLLLLYMGTAFAQDEFHHSYITVGGGAADPVGGTANYLSTAPLFQVGYGYRFDKWFQADAGLQIAFGAANNSNTEITDYGPVYGGDHEFMVPMGGRVYIPVPWERVELSVGGGAAFLHYSETIPSNPYIYNNCYTCTSRGGWGGYGQFSANYFLNSGHNFFAGTTVQFIDASTNGQPVGDVPGIKTTDHWVNAILELGISF